MFISSAFGGGLISNGEMLRGTYGNAGELGDMLPPKQFIHPNLELLKRILIKNGIAVGSIYSMRDNFDVNWPGVDEWIYKVQDSLDLLQHRVQHCWIHKLLYWVAISQEH